MNKLNTGKVNFTQTEIGRIPKEWDVVRLAEITIGLIGGGTPSTSQPEYWDGDIPWMTSANLTDRVVLRGMKNITEKGLRNSATNIVPKGSLLISTRVGIGKVGIAGIDIAISQDLTGLVLDTSKVGVEYLYWAFLNQSSHLGLLSQGSTVKGLTRDYLKNLRFFLPPLPEQKKIAEILSTVDQGIEKVDKAIQKTQRLKNGLMQELLTKGIGHKEFKDTEIGRIPKEWEVKKLGEVITLCQYGLSSKMSQAGEYPIIKMDDIVNGNVVPDKVKYINLDKKKFENFRLEKGDILFNRTNSYELVGRTGIFLLDGEYVFASYLIRLRPKGEVADSFFLTSYLIFSNEKLRRLATRAVHQANINATTLQKVMVLIPPLPEQQKIAEILSRVDERLELLRKRKERLERMKRGLMEDLLTGRKRVKLN